MNRSFVTYFFKYFEHVLGFTNFSWANNNIGMIFICCNNRVVDIVFVDFIDFWLLILDFGVIVVFSSILIVITSTNSFIFQVIIFVYFYVTSFTNSIHLICMFYLQNRAEQNRTEQLLTSFNRTDHINIEQNS